MSARVVAPVAPLRARTPGPQMTRRTPTLALNLAAASEGDGATPPPGGGAASTEKKRRRRRRAPKKKTADGAISGAKPKATAPNAADDTKSAPSKPKPNPRAASPLSPSKSSGGAVFMGTIDLDDNDLDDVLMRSLASRPDPNAVFRGTIDDDDLDLFATFDQTDIDAKVSAAASRLAAGDGPVPPPNGGHPDLAFLYDAAAVASIAGSDDEGVNAVEVVARCNESIKRSDSMDSVLALVREMTHAGIEPTESTYFAVMLVCRNNPNVGVARAMDVYEAMVANSVNGTCFFLFLWLFLFPYGHYETDVVFFYNSLAANVRFGARVQRTGAACGGGVAHQGRRRDRWSRHHTPHVRIVTQPARQRGRGEATGPETEAHSHVQALRGGTSILTRVRVGN